MKLAALIVETREFPDLKKIIDEYHMKYLPAGTDLIIYHSYVNEKTVKTAFPNAIFRNLGNAPMLMRDYNHFLINKQFWKSLCNYDRILIFQTDSRLLRTGIEEFYPYDYVGSPWIFQPHGGNGGLSLRNPAKMLEICERFQYSGIENEDVYFSNTMHRFPTLYKLAPRDVMTKFGVEAVFALGSLGIHAPWKWLKISQVKQILNQYNNAN